MARITHVQSAQKDQGRCRKCGSEIKAGDSYKWFANRIGRSSIKKKFCSRCPIRQSDMTTSDKLSTLYSAQETLEDAIPKAESLDDLAQALNEAASEARDVAEEYRDSVSNMPDSLQSSPQADEMNEKADNIESWADSLESAASEIEGMSDESEPEEDEECAACGHSYAEHKDKADATEAAAEATEPASEENDNPVCDEFERQEDWLDDARSRAEDACGELSV